MNSIDSLPPRQKDVLKQISKLTEEHGYPPTLAELAVALGLRNRMTVHQHVAALKRKGFVHWEPGLNRSLRVLAEVLGQEENNYLPAGKTESKKKSHLAAVGTTNLSHMDQGQIHERRDPSRLPLAGTIAAGQPIDAIDSGEYLDVESNYGGSGCYALRVKGESMIEDGIYDGDFVIVKPNPSPRNGEIVVALLEDGSATLKRFYKEKSGYRLQPANKNMQPIFVESSNNLQVQGTVVGLFRKMS